MIRSPSSISPSKIKMKPSIAGLESLVAKHVRIKMSKTLYTTDGAHVPSGITHAVSTVALIDISGKLFFNVRLRRFVSRLLNFGLSSKQHEILDF